ncbi:hypothetical protein Hanom_Chr03g00257381 [Helianthus anomalus]
MLCSLLVLLVFGVGFLLLFWLYILVGGGGFKRLTSRHVFTFTLCLALSPNGFLCFLRLLLFVSDVDLGDVLVVGFFVFDAALTMIVIVYFAKPVYIVCFVLWCSSTLTYTYFDGFLQSGDVLVRPFAFEGSYSMLRLMMFYLILRVLTCDDILACLQ